MTSTCSLNRGCAEVAQWPQSAMPKPTILDSEKPSSRIIYLDAKYLYGWAMSQPLPTGAFRWEEDSEQLAITIADHPADDPEGFILEVDLEYPEDLHNAHNVYPLSSERMVVQRKWMSEYQHNIRWRRQKLRSWSHTSVTRTAMCFSIGI